MFEQSKKNSKNPQKYFSKLFFIVFPPNLAHTKKRNIYIITIHILHLFAFQIKLFCSQEKNERETRNLEEQTFQDVTEIENNFFSVKMIGNK